MIKVGNDSFRHTQFGPKASETISQRRFLPKSKVCLSSVSSTNPSAQNSKPENNASDNTSCLLMYRRYNLLFYSQFSCAIARFLFLNISVSFRLAFSMYFLSSEDGLTICPCQLAQQDIILIVCAHGTGQHIPSF